MILRLTEKPNPFPVIPLVVKKRRKPLRRELDPQPLRPTMVSRHQRDGAVSALGYLVAFATWPSPHLGRSGFAAWWISSLHATPHGASLGPGHASDLQRWLSSNYGGQALGGDGLFYCLSAAMTTWPNPKGAFDAGLERVIGSTPRRRDEETPSTAHSG